MTAGLISSTHRAPVARLQYIVPPCTPFTFTARASCTQLGPLQQLHSSVSLPVTISPLFLDVFPVLTLIAHVVGTHNTIQVFASLTIPPVIFNVQRSSFIIARSPNPLHHTYTFTPTTAAFSRPFTIKISPEVKWIVIICIYVLHRRDFFSPVHIISSSSLSSRTISDNQTSRISFLPYVLGTHG